MNILMVTPHLPPHQAANALLPHLLGEGLRARGHGVRYLTFGPRAQEDGVVCVRRRKALRATRLPQLLEATETWWRGRALLRGSDVVHVHSSTWMNQVAARLCVRSGRPYVLTHYGTEIWHHDRRDGRFRRFNRDARHVAFYSRALLERARELEVPLPQASVVYPPVAREFAPLPEGERARLRSAYVPGGGALLLNVKRLHPLADQATLLEALGHVRRQRADVTLLVAGSGEEEGALKARAAALGLGDAVRFLGLVPNAEVARLQAAADLFVLSSVLEATPTVGTPVVSTDNPGGLELRDLLGEDVTVVPRRDPEALAGAVLAFLERPRRAAERTLRLVAERFSAASVVERYLELYRQAAA
jgi:glycosyltransferase involved in cell wall biosynthesis